MKATTQNTEYRWKCRRLIEPEMKCEMKTYEDCRILCDHLRRLASSEEFTWTALFARFCLERPESQTMQNLVEWFPPAWWPDSEQEQFYKFKDELERDEAEGFIDDGDSHAFNAFAFSEARKCVIVRKSMSVSE